MIYPLPVRDRVEGTVGDLEPLTIRDDVYEALKSIHPTSDVWALLSMPTEPAELEVEGDYKLSLRDTVVACRDVYNEGRSIQAYCDDHLSLVREVLMLRAKFCAMPWKERGLLRVDRHA